MPVDPGDAGPVVARGADRACDMRGVAVVVHRIVVAVREVPAPPVVDVAVPVVVDAVRTAAGAVLTGVDLHLGIEIGMRIVDARIDHGDGDGVAAGRHGPGFR